MTNTYHNDLLAPYLALPQGDKIQAECIYLSFYFILFSSNLSTDVWIDGDNGLRCKTTVSSPLFLPLLSFTYFFLLDYK